MSGAQRVNTPNQISLDVSRSAQITKLPINTEHAQHASLVNNSPLSVNALIVQGALSLQTATAARNAPTATLLKLDLPRVRNAKVTRRLLTTLALLAPLLATMVRAEILPPEIARIARLASPLTMITAHASHVLVTRTQTSQPKRYAKHARIIQFLLQMKTGTTLDANLAAILVSTWTTTFASSALLARSLQIRHAILVRA